MFILEMRGPVNIITFQYPSRCFNVFKRCVYVCSFMLFLHDVCVCVCVCLCGMFVCVCVIFQPPKATMIPLASQLS